MRLVLLARPYILLYCLFYLCLNDRINSMLVLEAKIYGKQAQYNVMDEAIRTGQFIRNKALRYWMDNKGVGKYQLSAYCKVLAAEFPFAQKLNSMARQSSADRAWAAISRFYTNCKNKVQGNKGFPKFKKHSRSIEYKTCAGAHRRPSVGESA